MKLPLTPIRCLYRAVDLYRKKLGIVSGDRRYTYGEFGERCERLAAGLRADGVRPGDRVAFLSYNNNQLLEGYYGRAAAKSDCHAAKCAADGGGAGADFEPCRTASAGV